MPRVVYCHGFASSPEGRKALALRALLEPEGIEFAVPDLNAPSFARLDWTAMVERAASVAAEWPTHVLVGSSLGALVALVAPTLGYGPAWTPALPPGDPVPLIDRDTGAVRPLHRAFVDSFLRGPEEVPPPPREVTIVAGRRDGIVPFERVQAVFDRWTTSGGLAAGSELIDLPDADHGMRGFDDVIAAAIRRHAR